jgi:hypothetical protein
MFDSPASAIFPKSISTIVSVLLLDGHLTISSSALLLEMDESKNIFEADKVGSLRERLSISGVGDFHATGDSTNR